MFEKLISDLKKSLPESLRKKMGGEEDLNEDSEELTESESDTESESSNSDEEKKKKRNSMIIRVAIILGIAYFAVDEFLIKPNGNEQSMDELIASAPKRKRPKPPKAQQEAAAPTTEVVTTSEVPPESSPPTTVATEEAPPVENINILDKNDMLPTTTTTPVIETTPVSEEVTETRVSEVNVDQKIDNLVSEVDQSSSNSSSSSVEEVQIPSQNEPKKDTSMASKIVDEVTETPAPAYDQLGRGLVYNCKDKYWACLDKPAYVTCNKNMKWNKSKGNAAECVVQNIYSSEEDCAKIQKYNVSSNVSTAFCQD